jgi:ribosomal protein S18 acetylase RimI-like enzyme
MPRRDPVPVLTRATARDVDEINRLFSDAFTERYHRDGMRSVRVPLLDGGVWRYAITVAGDGALTWRDPAGLIVAFNMVHAAGTEGWMGPLAVRPDHQGRGLGRIIVTAGVDRLKRAGCRVIGLETMPRTIDNIGFYSGLGFRPGHLTISVAREVTPADRAVALAVPPESAAVAECASLVGRLLPGIDFSREIEVTKRLDLGDLEVVRDPQGRVSAFALWHSAPLAAARPGDELRALKVVTADEPSLRRLLEGLVGRAAGLGLARVTIRAQTAYRRAYGVLLGSGFRPHWTDLRMTLEGYDDHCAGEGVVFSNWEI